jgi:hypothetical protein
MTKIESLELELKCRKLVEGTGLDWWVVLKCCGHFLCSGLFIAASSAESYEVALGIVEDKPVWQGDALWMPGYDCPQYVIDTMSLLGASWYPPAPKTVMVELPLEVASEAANCNWSHTTSGVISNACRVALDKERK